MALPGTNSFDDNTVIRYLLGDLPAGVASKLEERYFCDLAFFEHVGKIESELIRSADALSSRDRGLFERKYLTVPALRTKVESVRRANVTKCDGHTKRYGLRHLLWRPLYAVPVLAGIIVIATVMIWNSYDKNLGAAKVRIPDRISHSGTTQSGGILAITLPPGLLKGGQSEAKVLELKPETEVVQLTLLVPGADSKIAFADAELFRVEADRRTSVLTLSNVPLEGPGRPRTARLTIKADTLSRGDYLLYLRPAGVSVVANPVRMYAFSVDRN